MTNRLASLLQMQQATPKDPFLLFALAKEYESAGDAPQALAFYLELKETDPDYLGTYYHLGKLYEALEDLENAVFTYKEGIERSGRAGDRHAQSELQAALLNLEDPE